MRSLIIAVAMLAACGGRPAIPARGVVERDLGSWKFRRYQPVLDVEVWVQGNRAEAYTASYVADAAEKRGKVEDADIVNVFVTRYDRDDGVVRETVKLGRRLAAEQGYQVDEERIGGARTLSIRGHGEAWVMWPARRHVVKVGGRGIDRVPSAMVEGYADRYPSQLPGGALEGPLPPGPDAPVEERAYDPSDPSDPRPDMEHYDPTKTKIPAREPEADAAPKNPDREKPK